MAQFLGFGLTAANFYHPQVVLNVVANVCLMAACYCLIGRQGLLGAILAMLIAAIVQFAGSLTVLLAGLRKHVRLSAKTIAKPNVLGAISVSAERSPALHGGD